MGTEAGQPLETILRRKELERQAGDGVFAWGIGNSLGSSPAFAKKAALDGEVDILFSPMKSSPKGIDVEPVQLVLWLSYVSLDAGLVELPTHMLITSRGSAASGTAKRSHYALICEKREEIGSDRELGTIDARFVRNLVSLNPIGASQVTAMVRYKQDDVSNQEKAYPISFRARMHSEGMVRLGRPVPLIGSLLTTYQALCKVSGADDWLEGVMALKDQAKASMADTHQQQNLFAS